MEVKKDRHGFKTAYSAVEIYGYIFTLELKVNGRGLIKGQYRWRNDWLPKFGKWEILSFECIDPYTIEIAVKRIGGKRTNFKRVEFNPDDLVYYDGITQKEANKVIQSIATKIV